LPALLVLIKWYNKIEAMENIISNKIVDINDLFDDDFLNARSLYLHYFSALPNEFFINQIDGEKAFIKFKEVFAAGIDRVYRYQWYDTKKKEARFGRALVVLKNYCLVEFWTGWCEFWHNEKETEFLMEAAKVIAPFKQRQRREPLEINVVIRGKNKLELKPMEIKRTKLDIDLFYNPDFREVDAIIRQRLNKNKDKGIVLLHGAPGTGKTTYLRYLISHIRKRILFVSPAVANDLTNPDFIELLTSHPKTVLIIEDAENVIMDRRHNPGSSVSNLLNISDGLLADFLNVQVVCTFNSSLTLIDSALLRKGRLIAKYEFGKLNVTQSQRLSNHFGFDKVITRPMTIAEIANPEERQVEPDKGVIGFRSHVLIN
jgi:hypothetical protein